jgi:hypothetical protein
MPDYQSELFDDEEICKTIIIQQASNIITFGQYKGQPVEVLAQYLQYVKYLMKDNWLKINHPYIYQIVINNFCEPNDTPGHNVLQARFLNNDFCFSLGLLCHWKLMKKVNCIRNIDNAIRKINNMPDTYNYEYSKKWKNKKEHKSHKEYISEAVFEENSIEYIDGDCPLFEIEKLFEHDRMKNARTHPDFQYLIYEKYIATSVTLEQIKEIFKYFGFNVFSFVEIKNCNQLLLEDCK